LVNQYIWFGTLVIYGIVCFYVCSAVEFIRFCFRNLLHTEMAVCD